MPSPSAYIQYLRSIGWKWVFYRVIYSAKKKAGILFRQNPLSTGKEFYIPFENSHLIRGRFIFGPEQLAGIKKVQTPELKLQAEKILHGTITYFNGLEFSGQSTNSWMTDPTDGFIYKNDLHFTMMEDFASGRDIKFIWERSRFSYLLTIMRFNHHFDSDHSEFVLSEITSWIDENPFNCGPNYISGQEISIRVLNWIFLLTYYGASENLDPGRYKKIMQSIYDQLIHIETNIDFSQHLVRNNHIITEAAALFTGALIFKELPESQQWLARSKKILEKEIEFQIFKDGTYLQYSMNYHRVVVQILTLVIQMGKKHGISFSDNFNQRAERSLRFLFVCTNPQTGRLPNYGHNDGSLFFPLNNHDYSDFRPQLQALGNALGIGLFNAEFEDAGWFGAGNNLVARIANPAIPGVFTFPESGYYLINEQQAQTFIRCGEFKSRPAQADQLHLDITINNENVLFDGGTYLYNANPVDIKYFFGGASHNSVMLGDYDQMLKGKRFIWYYWSQLLDRDMEENDDSYIFTGTIKAFAQTGRWAIHTRKIIRSKTENRWTITDTIKKQNKLPINQIWNISAYGLEHLKFSATDAKGNILTPELKDGFYSPTYGVKIPSKRMLFTTNSNSITTNITVEA